MSAGAQHTPEQSAQKATLLCDVSFEPTLELERALSFGWIRRGKLGLGTVLVDVVDDGAGALNDAPSIL